MDWTSIFVEDGSEDLIIPQLMDRKQTTSRLTRLVSRVYHHHEGLGEDESVSGGHRLLDLPEDDGVAAGASYSLRAVYYLSINYILGVGCLGIPFAFARAGFVLCCLILLTVTVFSYTTVMWVAETGARFETEIKRISESPTEETSLVEHPAAHVDATGGLRYEVIDLVQFYLGRFQKMIYQISLMALMYIGLLAYSQVFCGAISAAFPWHGGLKGLPQLIFGFMVIPLSCMDLEEQLVIQSLMAAVRFVAIAVVVFGSVFALFADPSHSERESPPFFAVTDESNCDMSYTVCFQGFGVAFSTCMFSQLFQHSIPGLLRPLNDQPEQLRKAPRTFGDSLLTTSSFYFLLGTSAASYFGAETRSSINLNFADFMFGLEPSLLPRWLLVLLQILSKIVVIFPALDTISVFPLIANTLGNNLYASAGPGSIKSLAKSIVALKVKLQEKDFSTRLSYNERYASLPMQERKRALELSSKVASLFWRLVAAIPPLLGSMVATDLSFSFLLAGIAGIHVAFIAPSMLQLKSRRLNQKTLFSGWYSNPLLCYPVLAFSTFSFCVVLVQIRHAVMGGK